MYSYSLCFIHVAPSPLGLISLKEGTNDLFFGGDAYLSFGSLMDTQAAATAATVYGGHGSGFARRRRRL